MLKNAKPEPVHANVLFDLDNPDMALFETFHEKLQAAIERSPEFQKATGRKVLAPSQDASYEDDGAPF
jgi:hypothetical protein